MFEQSLLDGRGRSVQPSAVVASFLGQVVVLGILIVIPLIYTDALPVQALRNAIIIAPPPAPPPPPPPPAATPTAPKPRVKPKDCLLCAPKHIPEKPAVIIDEEPPTVVSSEPQSPGIVGGVPGGKENGIIGGTPKTPAPPPEKPVVKPVEQPKAEEKPATPQRIRVGGNVQSAKLVRQPKPVYPPLAKVGRIQGVVRLTAIIGKDLSLIHI